MVKQIFSHKIFLLLLLSLLLMVPVQSIMELNRERQTYCSGQEKLATVLCSNQNNRSDSFGVRPPL